MLLEIARNMCHRGPLNSQELISHWYAEIKKDPPNEIEGSFFFAVWTGLEPATPCVTGRYSNQLNYHTSFC